MEYAILLGAVVCMLSVWATTLYYGIGPMPASTDAVEHMLSCVTAEQELHELGAGFGGMAVRAAIRFPQKRICAYEGSPLPFLVCWFRSLKHSNLQVKLCNFERLTFPHGVCLLCYLSPIGMKRLSNGLSGWSGTLISYEFACRPHQPERIVELNNLYQSKVLVYKL